MPETADPRNMNEAQLCMPKLGETMESGLVVEWLITEGTSYKRGEILLEIETDKTVAEVPALEDGTLVKILHKAGDNVAVGKPIAKIMQRTAVAAPASATPTQKPTPVTPARQPKATVARPSNLDTGIRATPAARKLAKKAKISLAAIEGTGRNGRIESDDVTKAIEAQGAPQQSKPVSSKPSAVQFAHDIAHVTIGDRAAKPVLLLHGFAGDHTTLTALGTALAKRGCYVLAPDLPGHGETKLEAKSIADLDANMVRLCQDSFSSQPVNVCAHSLGASVALAVASELELSSLTLIAPAQLGVGVDPKFVTGMADPSDREHIAKLISMLTHQLEVLSPKAIDEIYATQAKGRLSALAELLATENEGESNRAKLAELASKVPTRVLLGREDAILNWEKMAALQLSSLIGLHLFADTGHTPQWEAFNETLSVLLDQINAT